MAEKKSESVEQGFNDAELQDIMDEIENLEREFAEGEEEAVEQTTASVTAEDLAGLDDVEEDDNAGEEEHHSTMAPVTHLKKAPPTAAVPAGAMDFSASGQMAVRLQFPVGARQAQLSIQAGTLVVELDGVRLCIDESNGCQVEMAGGVHFSVPLKRPA